LYLDRSGDPRIDKSRVAASGLIIFRIKKPRRLALARRRVVRLSIYITRLIQSIHGLPSERQVARPNKGRRCGEGDGEWRRGERGKSRGSAYLFRTKVSRVLMVLVSWHSRAILLRPLFPSFWGRQGRQGRRRRRRRWWWQRWRRRRR